MKNSFDNLLVQKGGADVIYECYLTPGGRGGFVPPWLPLGGGALVTHPVHGAPLTPALPGVTCGR